MYKERNYAGKQPTYTVNNTANASSKYKSKKAPPFPPKLDHVGQVGYYLDKHTFKIIHGKIVEIHETLYANPNDWHERIKCLMTIECEGDSGVFTITNNSDKLVGEVLFPTYEEAAEKRNEIRQFTEEMKAEETEIESKTESSILVEDDFKVPYNAISEYNQASIREKSIRKISSPPSKIVSIHEDELDTVEKNDLERQLFG